MDVNIREKINYVISEIQHETQAIESAVLNIGVPLEEAICFFVRSRLQDSARRFREKREGPVTL